MATRGEQAGGEKVSLSDRQLVDWPCGDIPNYVTTLHLSSNSISSIPDEIERLTFLKELDVSNNRIEKISENFGGLEFLEIFVAKNNKLSELPESFAKLKNLKQLNLAGNSLKSIPIEVCDLTRLNFLHLGGNSIKEIPSEIKHIERWVSFKTCRLECCVHLRTTLARSLRDVWRIKQPLRDCSMLTPRLTAKKMVYFNNFQIMLQ